MTDVDDYVAGGRAMQRFWLEATRQGLQFQPEMTPLIFSRYVAQDLRFTEVDREQRLAGELAVQLDEHPGAGSGRAPAGVHGARRRRRPSPLSLCSSAAGKAVLPGTG